MSEEHHPHAPLRCYFQMALVQCLLGGSVVAGKVMVARVPVLLAAWFSLLLAALVLTPLMLRLERGLPRIARREWLFLIAQALFGVFLWRILLLYGLRLTSAAEAGIVSSATPAMVGFCSFLILGERLGQRRAGAIALTVTGLLALHLPELTGQGARGAAPLLGNLLVLGSVLCEALFVICGKAAVRRVHPITVSTLNNLMGLAMFLPFALWQLQAFPLGRLEGVDWLLFAYHGILLAAFGAVLWFEAMSHVPGSTAAVFAGLIPLSALTAGWYFLDESLGLRHLLGSLCVLAAIGLIARSRSRRQATTPPGNGLQPVNYDTAD